jgi:hypothetical protein
VVDQTISVINISNGLTLTGVQAQKDIVQAKRKDPSCGKTCQAEQKVKEEKLNKLYEITKEGYISLKSTEVSKLNESTEIEKGLYNKIAAMGTANILDHMERQYTLDDLYNISKTNGTEFSKKVDELLPYSRSLADAQNQAYAGMSVEDVKSKQIFLEIISSGTNYLPVYGQLKGFGELVTGTDYITGRELDTLERVSFINSTAKGLVQIDDFLSGLKPSKPTEVEIAGIGKVKVDDNNLDELNSKVSEASKNDSSTFKWGNPRSKPTYGHTFLDHGSKVKDFQLIDRARSLEHQVGNWSNDKVAADFLEEIAKRGAGTYDVPLPNSVQGKTFLPTGVELKPDMARVVVKPDGTIRTAFPYSSNYPTSAPK